MLATIRLGSHDISNEFEIIKDSYDNVYFENKSIHQRIRLGKKLPVELELDQNTPVIKTYKIPRFISISNNYKNMNLSIMKFYSKDKDIIETRKDDCILYLTISNKNYKLLKYEVNERDDIVQTYKSAKEEYQGCAIRFTETTQNVAVIYLKEYSTNKFIRTTIDISDGKFTVSKNEVERDSKEEKTLVNIANKFAKRIIHFKIRVQQGILLTNTYIIDDESKVPPEIGNQYPNSTIIVLSAGTDTFNERRSQEEKDSVHELLEENLVKERIRAVTLINIDVPYDFCREYKLLYLFKYDTEKKQLTCIKSN